MTEAYDYGFSPDELINSEDLVPPEKLTPEDLQWFAGAFEVGGAMGIGVSKNKTNPYMRIQDSNEDLIDTLQARFGGSKSRDSKRNSFMWILNGRRAAETMVEMEPYLVSREELSLAAYNWLQTDDQDSRLQIARELKESQITEIEPEQYQQRVIRYKDLVEEPAFLAGVIDNRASISPKTKGNSILPNISIRSTNGALLEAIKEVYGGTHYIKTPKGSTEIINDTEVVLTQNSYSLSVYAAQARTIIQTIFPYIKTKPYDGWDIRYVDQYQALMQQQTDIIEALTREELDLFYAGSIDRLRTIEELAAAVGISPRVIKERMIDLPEDLRKEREQIQNRFAKRILSRDDISNLQTMLLQEVQEFLEGRREHLTRDTQLADLMGVSVSVIRKHIIHTLDPEVRSLRTRTFLSENAKARNEKYGNPFQKKTE